MPIWTDADSRRLLEVRRKLGWTQSQVARKCNVSPATIGSLEHSAKDGIHGTTIKKINRFMTRMAVKLNGSVAPGVNNKCSGADECMLKLTEAATERIEKAIDRIEKKIGRETGTIITEILKALERMDWRDFESGFLRSLLEGLGYENVVITQPVRDGGVDAMCREEGGGEEVFVSAKRWDKPVGAPEVRDIRGAGGKKALLVCLGASPNAYTVAEKEGENLRPIEILSGPDLAFACVDAGLLPGVTLVSTFGIDDE
ncbi:restriction endonuclease [Myxococcota bacterium]